MLVWRYCNQGDEFILLETTEPEILRVAVVQENIKNYLGRVDGRRDTTTKGDILCL